MDDQKYPKEFHEGADDQSAGFVTPYKLGTGVLRGTQTIINTDGSKITIGLVPDSTTDYGITFFNTNGDLVTKLVGATQYVYDLNTKKNIMQIGLLPDGSYGMAVAKAGYNVSDGIS